ncbi:hypothetical protein DL93DRAFT_1052197 [Clavulina sp. PMI_390]|nr:hypothetical protein DL93DRAFT_1052197 [Clavulina sp. PMI_390]
MPVSAAIIPASKKGTASSSQPAPIPISRTMGDPEDLLTSSRRPRWLRLGHRNDSAQILPMTGIPPPPDRLPATSGQPEGEPSNLGTTPSTPTREALDKLQLTVLITMPNSSNRHYHPSMSQADDTSSIDFDDDKKPAVAPHAPRGPEISTIDADDDDDEEEEIPEVVFGITEVLWDAGLDWKPQPPKVEGGEDRA